MKKRLIFGMLLGAILGVVCIVGAQLRMPGELTPIYLFAFWFNRVVMGMMIGLSSRPKAIVVGIVRGIFFGAFVSFAFYSATAFSDLMGFLAGVVYGVIIETVLFVLVESKKKTIDSADIS
jgi:hypothetical protein